jgi:thiol-disulfide isomerase/thioredoxin
MKFPDRLAYERRVLEELTAKYPRELVLHEKLRDIKHNGFPEDYPALRNRWLKMAKDNPDDPLALLLGGEAEWGKDTGESIRLFEIAKAKAANFPWPARELAGLYFSGKHADPAKAKQNLEAFFASCPTSTDGYAQFLLNRDPSLQQKVKLATAVSLRARLENETDPRRLKDFERLWSLEFQTRPPKEHDALRAQVARDLERLEKLNPGGDAPWQALLIHGYKQSGASKESITTMEDGLLLKFPHSSEAYHIVRDRWDAAHKEPSDQTDAPAWERYEREYENAASGWIRDYPNDAWVQRFLWFDTVEYHKSLSEKDGVAAVDHFVESVKDFEPWGIWNYFPAAAQFLIERGWQPRRALDLLKQARTSIDRDRNRDRDDDNLTEDELRQREDWQKQQDLQLNGLMLKAAMEARLPDEAIQLRSSIEAPPPKDNKLQSQYWWNRARLEAIQNHGQDALAHYQLALGTRTDLPKPSHGSLRDDLTEEARTLWKAQGGTDAAWDIWSKPASGRTEQLAEGGWVAPMKVAPNFELQDLSGKTWRLKDLAGRAVLINVWATWCGPCQAELPQLEEFYEKVKNRSDVQVLTFNIDEDLGLVAPYLKEKGYTFPVLPAFSAGVLSDFGVPQNWVVDPHGIWRWKQSGYADEGYADFEKEMLDRLASAISTQ